MKIKLTELEKKVLSELLDTNDGQCEFDLDYSWCWLNNCKSAGNKSFSGVLGSLSKKGLYIDGGDGGINGKVNRVKATSIMSESKKLVCEAELDDDLNILDVSNVTSKQVNRHKRIGDDSDIYRKISVYASSGAIIVDIETRGRFGDLETKSYSVPMRAFIEAVVNFSKMEV